MVEVEETADKETTVADDPAFLTRVFGYAARGSAAAFLSRSRTHSILVAQRFS